jgi:hypothetical protein
VHPLLPCALVLKFLFFLLKLEEYHDGALSASHSSLLAPFSYVAWLYTADTEKNVLMGKHKLLHVTSGFCNGLMGKQTPSFLAGNMSLGPILSPIRHLILQGDTPLP